jgi:tRNA-Thr(GGU) m(6)t(6)A37 methyltransferase TsaA
MTMKIELESIGVIHSPFREKFGIPRQPGLVPQIRATLELQPPYNRPEAVQALDGYSHIWLQFVFHRAQREQWQPMVRPPRLGGNQRVGVFASRSPFRPNPIGLSVVELCQVHCREDGVVLELAGVDLLDGTPVLDIKPYVPYADSLPHARAGFAAAAPEQRLSVHFSAQAEVQLAERKDDGSLRGVIEGLLAIDPRPAYVGNERAGRVYGMQLYDFDLRWRVEDDLVEVIELLSITA